MSPFLLLLALVVLWGCENDTSNQVTDPGGGTDPTGKSCLGCHESEEMLKASLGVEKGSEVPVPHKDDG
jgi:hypothetical protein